MYGFVIHSVEDGLAPHGVNDNTVLLCAFFTEEGNDAKKRFRMIAICDEAHRLCMLQLQAKLKSKIDVG